MNDPEADEPMVRVTGDAVAVELLTRALAAAEAGDTVAERAAWEALGALAARPGPAPEAEG